MRRALSRRAAATLCSVGCLLSLGQTAAGDTPVASTPRGLRAITVPAGFEVELVAAPPLIERPMLAAFDDCGRLYVCDSAGVNLRGPQLTENPPHAIRMLEDVDGDGRFDKSTVFADQLVFPQGIEWHDGAVFCSSPPSFWRLEDTDGDGVADKRQELATGFANTGVADDMHGASLGPDGRIYWCAGRFPHEIRRPGGPVIHQGTAPLILRCRPDGSELEVVCGSQGNAVGVAFTPAGDIFASGTFLASNAMGAGLRDALVHCVDGAEYPVRDRHLNEHKRTGELLPPLAHLGVSASSDLAIYRSTALGEEFRGHLFSALFNMHKVMRHRIERSGATFTCRNEDFLVSADPDFHPTDVLEDADGSLLVIDTGGWFRIGCPTSQVAKPDVLGAIYRLRRTAAGPADDPRGRGIRWESLSASELCGLLSDNRFAVRDRAVAALARRSDAETVEALAAVVAASGSAETKCAAVWALTRLEHDGARAGIRRALHDNDPGVRQAAARAAGLHRDAQALGELSELVTTDSPPVRREAATSLGRIGRRDAVQPLLAALDAAAEDRFLEHAIIFALIRIADCDATRAALRSTSSQQKRGALIALDQMDDSPLTAEMVVPLLDPADPVLRQTALWIVSHHPDWARSLLSLFREWLARPDLDAAGRGSLRHQLLAFGGDTAVQELVASPLTESATDTETRLLLLEVMAQAPIAALPACWTPALRKSLADADPRIVRQTVATLRALPLDKRPLESRVVAAVNFAETAGPFAETRLSDNFCVRFSGLVRIPRDGAYTFYLNSDDGSQLYLDGALVVDNGGSHAMRERSGQATLSAGDHELRLDFIEHDGEAGCILSWSFEGVEKQFVPADALFHRPRTAKRDASAVEPGLVAEFYALGGATETFPDPAAGAFDEPLAQVASDTAAHPELRVQAAAAVAHRLAALEPALFDFLRASLDESNPPLVRLDAAEALSRARLDKEQLAALCAALGRCGPLEVPKLLRAFEQSSDAEIGGQLIAALARSPGLAAVRGDALSAALASYPESIRTAAAPLVSHLASDVEKQRAKLESLADVLAGGEIQRGRDLFFANKKAICATCHAAQGQGGKIGPDLSKIGTIRSPRDLLEAIVAPSASFARGYEAFTAVLADGRVHTGVIVRETADAVYLFGTDRLEIRVPRGSIESLQQSPVSIMPEGMDAQLSRQDLADLIAFLQSLR